MADVRVFGIRHHGPGSARSLAAALDVFRPDVVLVEGPPEGNAVLALAADPEMRPPVALLVYAPDEPRRAAYWPFAVFSPEWIALQHAFGRGVPARFVDLPAARQLAREAEEERQDGEREPAHADPTSPVVPSGARDLLSGVTGPGTRGGAVRAPGPRTSDSRSLAPLGTTEEAGDRPAHSLISPTAALAADIRRDPLAALARAAGHEDGERWWEQLVEERRDHTGAFEAVAEAMTALRAAADTGLTDDPASHLDALREAAMRQGIRQAARDGFARVAVVCGAWHVPALAGPLPPAKVDTALLRDAAPRLKVQATWIPWTAARLARASGYGAGVTSPGWYAHLWTHGAGVDAATAWMTDAARLLREEGLAASSAGVIDAVRLAATLAALRGRAVPGLAELVEGAQAVLVQGDEAPMVLIRERLLVGDALGSVPDASPALPLQAALARDQKRLRLAPAAADRALALDLRTPLDRDRSLLLHRLTLLGVRWGTPTEAAGKGTFRETWRLAWQPELALAVIEAARWGNTVADAATARGADLAERAAELPALAGVLAQLLVAELPEATARALARLDALAAVASDVGALADALPALARTLRYGDVRASAGDPGILGAVVAGLVTRLAAGLPAACASLDDEAAAQWYARLIAVDDALGRLNDAVLVRSWRDALARVQARAGVHGLVAGRACRLLADAGALAPDVLQRRWAEALARGTDPGAAAAWVEGFLRDAGTRLVHDPALWPLLDGWLAELPEEAFSAALPLLRRTVATFSAPERRKLGERARAATRPEAWHSPVPDDQATTPFDAARAAAVLPTLAALLGA